jgi:DMSO reductase anchor subunit
VPAFQPDRRIVTKCDLCNPRLEAGMAPACVSACPTHAITVEKVEVAAWRADHAAADAPELPSGDLTLSTTRIELPREVPAETFAASDWGLRPEHPHWSLVWLTLLSQLAVGVSSTVGSTGERLLAAALAGAALVGATFHLGRPAVAYKALRNLRRSWLSREVALLSLYAALALVAVAVPALAVPAAVVGVAGLYASARLYVVPGRPAWDSPLTIVRFLATAAALGPVLTGHRWWGLGGALVGLAATALNWLRLSRHDGRAWRGPLRLELGWFRRWAVARWAATAVGVAALLAGLPPIVAFLPLAVGEAVGRWLFYVTVVPLDMPGSFWRASRAGAR